MVFDCLHMVTLQNQYKEQSNSKKWNMLKLSTPFSSYCRYHLPANLSSCTCWSFIGNMVEFTTMFLVLYASAGFPCLLPQNEKIEEFLSFLR